MLLALLNTSRLVHTGWSDWWPPTTSFEPYRVTGRLSYGAPTHMAALVLGRIASFAVRPQALIPEEEVFTIPLLSPCLWVNPLPCRRCEDLHLLTPRSVSHYGKSIVKEKSRKRARFPLARGPRHTPTLILFPNGFGMSPRCRWCVPISCTSRFHDCQTSTVVGHSHDLVVY